MIISKVVKHYSKINNNLRMKTSLVPDPRQQKGNEGSTRILELTRYIFQKANTYFFLSKMEQTQNTGDHTSGHVFHSMALKSLLANQAAFSACMAQLLHVYAF
jgi:hypothetical protein